MVVEEQHMSMPVNPVGPLVARQGDESIRRVECAGLALDLGPVRRRFVESDGSEVVVIGQRDNVQPGRIARTAYRTARGLWESSEAATAVARTIGLDRLPLAGGIFRTNGPEVDADRIPQTPAPRTPFNRSITPHRRFCFFTLSLSRFNALN